MSGALRDCLCLFGRNANGNVAVTFALAMMPVLAAVGGAVDYSRANSAKAALQAALDSAALNVVKDAGATASDQLTTRATDVFTGSFHRPEAKNVQVAAVYDPTAKKLTVNGSAQVPTSVMGIMGVSTMNITGTAAALAGSDAGPCVIALAGAGKQTFFTSGAGTVNVPNCGIYVNSSDAAAVDQTGGGYIKAKAISVVGKAAAGNYTPTPKINQPVIADPLAAIPEPTMPATCTYNKVTFSVATTLPANSVYCGTTAFNANVTFAPGIHYFKGAVVTTGTNVAIVANQAMLYFDDKSTWDSTGTGSISFTAPQSGTYAGISIFGTRAGAASIFKLTGGKDYFVNGTIYLPTVDLKLYGNVDLTVTAKSGYVIAHKFYYQGDSSFSFDAYGGAVPNAMASAKSSLVK